MDKPTIKASELGKIKGDPVLKGLPDNLKDPKMFNEVEQKIRLIMVSDHKHRKVQAFVKCKKCQGKIKKRHDALMEFGFKSYEQYLKWRRIMIIIKGEKDFQII